MMSEACLSLQTGYEDKFAEKNCEAHEWTDQNQCQPPLSSVSELLKDVFKNLYISKKSHVLSRIAGYYPKSCFLQRKIIQLGVKPLEKKEQVGLHLQPNVIPRNAKYIEKQERIPAQPSLSFSEYQWKKRQLRWRWNPAERTGTEIVTSSETNYLPPGVCVRGTVNLMGSHTPIIHFARNDVATKLKDSHVLSKRRHIKPPVVSYTLEGAFLGREASHQMESAATFSPQHRMISEHFELSTILNQSQRKPSDISSGIERVFLGGECSHIIGLPYISCPQNRMIYTGMRYVTISSPEQMTILKSSPEIEGIFTRLNHSTLMGSTVTFCSQLKITTENTSLPMISNTPPVASYKVDEVFMKAECTLGLLLPRTASPLYVTLSPTSSLLKESLNFDLFSQSNEEEVQFLSRIVSGRSFTTRSINVGHNNLRRPQTAVLHTKTEPSVEADQVSCRSIYTSGFVEENQDSIIKSGVVVLSSRCFNSDGDTTEINSSMEGLCSSTRTSSVEFVQMFAEPETVYSSEVLLFPSADTLPIMEETERTGPLRLSRDLYKSLIRPLFHTKKNYDSSAGSCVPEGINGQNMNSKAVVVSELVDLEQDILAPAVVVPELDFSAIQLRLGSSGQAESLGRGSYGAVFLGELVGENKSVALKASLGTCSEADLLNEARIQLFLKDTGYVAEVYGVVRLDLLCIVQEFVANGTTLYDLMTSSSNTTSRSTWLSIAYQLVCGLSEIHKKCVLHNDLKSDNVLIDTSGERATVIFIDFGLATYRQGFVFEGALENISECYYLAPEVRSGNRSSNESDIYSLGFLFRDIAIVSDILELIPIADCCTQHDLSCRPILEHLKNALEDLLDSS